MRLVFSFLMILICAGCAIAQTPVDPGKPISADSSIDEILDIMHVRGKDLKDFSADVNMEVVDNATGDQFTRTGKVWYQSQPDTGGRLRVVFDKKLTDAKSIDLKSEYLLEGQWLTDRDYRTKNEVRRQVLRPGEKMNLLKLGEGPFPLPIGQDKADVHKLFDVEKKPLDKDDPKDSVHLALTPKKDTQFAKKFKSIEFWLGPSDTLPARIDTTDADGTSTRTTKLENVKVNSGLKDADFALPPIDKDWTRHEEAF